MEFISQVIASAVGGLVAGAFVVVGVMLQFFRQSEAALRALMVEVTANKEVALEMTQSPSYSNVGFELGHPDPGWLKHSIWDSQVPYVVRLLDEGTLILVRRAYSLLEGVPAMATGAGPGSQRYSHGGWIDGELRKIQTAFSDADQALLNLRKRLDSETWVQRLKRIVMP